LQALLEHFDGPDRGEDFLVPRQAHWVHRGCGQQFDMPGRLRAASVNFSSAASIMINTLSSA
jgi:hypothetical protein